MGADELVTVSRKVSLAVPEPSLTVTVMVAVPDCPAAGVAVTVRLAPDPANPMLLRIGTLHFVYS